MEESLRYFGSKVDALIRGQSLTRERSQRSVQADPEERAAGPATGRIPGRHNRQRCHRPGDCRHLGSDL